ncbi:hypothetical protein TNCV_218271 [Trichonephila clavipes]|nr:hypothetical protein TNCV_218271 [Trichonephila clavipes]
MTGDRVWRETAIVAPNGFVCKTDASLTTMILRTEELDMGRRIHQSFWTSLIFIFIFFFRVAVNAPLIRPVQLAVPDDPRYARLVTNMRIEKAREKWEYGGGSLVTSLLCVAELCIVKKWSWKLCHDWQHM